jgi:uncharacterized protein
MTTELVRTGGEPPARDPARLLDGVAPAEWDRLAGRNFYSSAAWLGFCATDFGSDSGVAVSYRDRAPVCAVPFVEAGGSLFATYRWYEILPACGLPTPPRRGVLVGPREGYQTPLRGADAGASAEEVHAVVQRVRDFVADNHSGSQSACVAMYVPTEDALAMQRAGVVAPPVLLEADAWIEVPDGGWAAWEERLSSKRRQRVRREVRRFHDAGFHIEHWPLSACWQQLGRLARATLAKHGQDGEAEAELAGVLRNHVRCLGEAAQTALLWDVEGALVGFCLYYVWGDTIFLRWAGFDYKRLAGSGEYFNVVYYAQVEVASELGLRWLHAGVKSIDAKALRGAQLRPLWLVDLSENSPLTEAADRVRQHNAKRYERLKADPRTGTALDEEAWEPFR